MNPPRKWLSFSIRDLLWLTLVIVLGVDWFAQYRIQSAEHTTALSKVISYNRKLEYEVIAAEDALMALRRRLFPMKLDDDNKMVPVGELLFRNAELSPLGNSYLSERLFNENAQLRQESGQRGLLLQTQTKIIHDLKEEIAAFKEGK